MANLSHTICAFDLLGVGLVGMSHFASPKSYENGEFDRGVHQVLATDEEVDDTFVNSDDDGDIYRSRRRIRSNDNMPGPLLENNTNESRHASTVLRRSLSSHEDDSSIEEDGDSEIMPPSFNAETHVQLVRRVYSKRRIGIVAAVANGILAGSSLIPVHYAKKHGFGGANYMMSYAVGAFMANLMVWLIYYAVVVVRLRPLGLSWAERLLRAAGDMPDPHWEQLWKPGLCAGLLLATAMFGSILAVTYLGQGIGNSVIQAKIMIRFVLAISDHVMCDLHAMKWFFFSHIVLLAVAYGASTTTKKFAIPGLSEIGFFRRP